MSTKGLRKPTVLAVDDTRANLLVLDAVLAQDFELIFAESGAQALSKVSEHPQIDVILLDVQMPDMDGFQTAAAIRKLDGVKEIPIIFITAVHTEDPHIRKGYEAGGIDYFTKPFDPEILKLKLRIYAAFRSRENILRQRERHLKESEELLRAGRKLTAVLESLTVGVLIADSEGRVCQTTEEVSRILKSVESAENDHYGELLGWWDREGRMIKSHDGPLARALHKGKTTHSEPIAIRCFDGSTKNILASASPLRGLDKRIVGAVVLIQDITEPKKMEEAIEERVTRLIGLGADLEASAVRTD
jgi:response regulator RpfG family c-di-GMP phosphodiesterase